MWNGHLLKNKYLLLLWFERVHVWAARQRWEPSERRRRWTVTLLNIKDEGVPQQLFLFISQWKHLHTYIHLLICPSTTFFSPSPSARKFITLQHWGNSTPKSCFSLFTGLLVATAADNICRMNTDFREQSVLLMNFPQLIWLIITLYRTLPNSCVATNRIERCERNKQSEWKGDGASG